MEEIPREILGEIFVKLSVKDILRCRQVCKSWLSMISDPQFANHHLNSVKPIMIHKDRIIVRYIFVQTNDAKVKQKHVVEIHGLESNDPKGVKLPFCEETKQIEFFGSCNGLLLVGTGDKDLFLWNPYIGSYSQIPCPWFHFKQDYPTTETRVIRLYGFCYDSLMETYKIVVIVRMIHETTKYDSTMVGVYNSKTESWKNIDNFPYKVTVDGQGTIMNGTPHWIVTRIDEGRKHVIIYLDLAEDVFKEVETCLPTWLANCSSPRLRLVCLKESLCIADTLEVCVMKEPGMCWIKLPNVEWISLYRITMTPSVLRNIKRGMLHLMYWHRKRGESRLAYENEEILGFDGSVTVVLFETVTFSPSLVSPLTLNSF